MSESPKKCVTTYFPKREAPKIEEAYTSADYLPILLFVVK